MIRQHTTTLGCAVATLCIVSTLRWPLSCPRCWRCTLPICPPSCHCQPSRSLGPRGRPKVPGLRLVMAARVGACLAAAGRGDPPVQLAFAGPPGQRYCTLAADKAFAVLAHARRRSAATADPGNRLGGGAVFPWAPR